MAVTISTARSASSRGQERTLRDVVGPEADVVLTVTGAGVAPPEGEEHGILVRREREGAAQRLGADALPAQVVLDAFEAHPRGDDLVPGGDESPEPALAHQRRAGRAPRMP